MNPRTLHVPLQFHVIFDDNFITVPAMRSDDIPDNWKDLVTTSNSIFQDFTGDVEFKQDARSTQLEHKIHQPTDPLLDPQIINDSVHINKPNNNDTNFNQLELFNDILALISRENLPDSKSETTNSEGATPPIVPILTGVHVSEEASHNSTQTTDDYEGVTPTTPDHEGVHKLLHPMIRPYLCHSYQILMIPRYEDQNVLV